MPWLTPDSALYPPRYRALLVPDDVAWISIVSGAILEITFRQNWQQFGTMTIEEAARVGEQILESWITQDVGMVVGQVIMAAWAAPAPNYLLCDGAEYAAADYPQLYAVIHPNYYEDIGPDATFKVPDMRGRVPRGVGDGPSTAEVITGEEGGSAEKTIEINHLPSHQHTYFKPGVNIDLEAPGAPDIFAGGVGVPDLTGAVGGGEPLDVLNPYLGISFYILAKV